MEVSDFEILLADGGSFHNVKGVSEKKPYHYQPSLLALLKTISALKSRVILSALKSRVIAKRSRVYIKKD